MLRTSMALTLLAGLLSGDFAESSEHRRSRSRSSAEQKAVLSKEIPQLTMVQQAEQQQIEWEAKLKLGRDLMSRK